jgi:aminopeptidase N
MYFEVLPRVWADRTMEIATSITVGLFPFFLIDQATVDAASQFLATDGLHPAMARLVSENRDGMERALRARARDAQD